MKYKKHIIGFSSLTFIIVATLFFSGCFKQENQGIPYKIDELEVWGVFDDSDVFREINAEFADGNPRVEKIRYKKISANAKDFEAELVDAFASNKGPDVLFFNSNWLFEHGDKIAPLANSESKLSFYKENFPDVSYSDFVLDNQIYAMPLYNDTLALFYNKDLLNQAGISSPPETWEDVRDQTKILTEIDSEGNITKSAIALGRSKEPGAINRSSDILMLMMLQGGSSMSRGRFYEAAFDDSANGGSTSPGSNALTFYTQFAQANSEIYTWNSKMDYSIDSFRYGRVAMTINYSYWIDRFREMDPKLNFDVAPMPQLDLENKVNYGVYWGLAVGKTRELPQEIEYTNEDRIKESWSYVSFVTSKPSQGAAFDPTKKYLEITNKPPARRDLIEEMKNDPDIGVFAEQALTAKTWRQADDGAVEEIFVDMIDEVISGKSTTTEAVSSAESRFNNLIDR